MKKSILLLDNINGNYYQAIFRNNHGRKIYIKLLYNNGNVIIHDCFYIDRPRSGNVSVPKLWKTKKCNSDNLLKIIENELDKHFYGVQIINSSGNMSTEDYIKTKLYYMEKEKYRFFILVEKDGVLYTRFKNRVHRLIYIKFKNCGNGKWVICSCYYCDRKTKREKAHITPVGLNTIYFDYSTKNILNIVNEELNCNFTDVIITKDSFNFEDSLLPVCGCI